MFLDGRKKEPASHRDRQTDTAIRDTMIVTSHAPFKEHSTTTSKLQFQICDVIKFAGMKELSLFKSQRYFTHINIVVPTACYSNNNRLNTQQAQQMTVNNNNKKNTSCKCLHRPIAGFNNGECAPYFIVILFRRSIVRAFSSHLPVWL